MSDWLVTRRTSMGHALCPTRGAPAFELLGAKPGTPLWRSADEEYFSSDLSNLRPHSSISMGEVLLTSPPERDREMSWLGRGTRPIVSVLGMHREVTCFFRRIPARRRVLLFHSEGWVSSRRGLAEREGLWVQGLPLPRPMELPLFTLKGHGAQAL